MTDILRLSEWDEAALDHPIWSALAGEQKELALGLGLPGDTRGVSAL
jgi:hypothetical protein